MSNGNINNDEELWRAFGEEVGEQLDKLDFELTRGTAVCDIHQVFRDFHTIKSSCAMLDMGSMKELAHVSEDYLDLVRRGSLKLTEQSIDVLLLAVETLKHQLSIVMETRQNPASAVDIMAMIQQLIGLPSGLQDKSLSTSRGHAAAQATVKSEVCSNLEQLAEDSRRVLLELAQARQLTPALKNQLINFGNMAQLLDFPLLQVLCRDIVLSFPVAASATLPSNLLHHEMDLMDRIRHLEEEYRVDCGSAAATLAFRSSLEKEFIRLVLVLADIFADMNPMDLFSWLAERHAAVESTLEKLALFSALCGLPELRNLFAYVIQVVRSARRGYFQPSVEFATLLQQAIDHPYGDLLQDGESLLGNALARCREGLEQATRSREVFHPAMTSRYEIDIHMVNESAVVEQLVEWISLHGNMLHSTSSFDDEKGSGITFQAEFNLALPHIVEQLQAIDKDALYFRVREKDGSPLAPATSASAVQHDPLKHDPLKATMDMPQLLGSTLRISSQVIDNLVTQVGEVVMARNMIGSLIQREQYEILSRKCRYLLERNKSGVATPQQTEELKTGLLELIAVRDGLVAYDMRLHAAISQVQERVLDLREMPVAMIFNRLPNIVRKVSHSLGKSVSLKTSGQDACIDKGMMDILLKTLARLLQHLVVKGVNTRELSVQARALGNHLEISLLCDSAVSDQEAFIEVKHWLDRIGGLLSVDSSQEDRTIVSLDFPRTVAMQTLLLTKSGQSITALSERNIIEIRRFKGSSVHTLQGRASLAWRGQIIPLVNLEEWTHGVEHDASRLDGESGSLVIMGNGIQHVGIRVDEIVGLRNSFVPENHSAFSALSHINGSTILGDGSVVFLLNVEHLMQSLYGRLHKLFHSVNEHSVNEQERAA